jgi:hypothetical protein
VNPTRRHPAQGSLQVAFRSLPHWTRPTPHRHASALHEFRGTIGGHNPVETQRNPGKERGPPPRKSAYLQGESGRGRAITVCLPCRRSWVRVPSAASEKCPVPSGFRALQPVPSIGLWALVASGDDSRTDPSSLTDALRSSADDPLEGLRASVADVRDLLMDVSDQGRVGVPIRCVVRLGGRFGSTRKEGAQQARPRTRAIGLTEADAAARMTIGMRHGRTDVSCRTQRGTERVEAPRDRPCPRGRRHARAR